MGKIPAIILAIIALWIALNVYQGGPDNAFGGLSKLLSEPQYGEADRPSRSTSLADQVLDHDPAVDQPRDDDP